jgi:phosphoribosyl 1,2-cyclic phosphodiesterase/DNA-binding response OmpR family regulator
MQAFKGVPQECTSPTMKIRFWGTRGSIAKPGQATVRYGGNTSCVELRTAGGTLIVIDCGTGAHGLGQHLVSEGHGGRRGHILISHTHWDHIQGIPFFQPLFGNGHEWDIYGPKGLSTSLRETLAGQMEHSYFPVALDQFAATIRYHDLVEGSFTIGDVKVTTRYLNHPALTIGYRLEADGAVLVYCCDHGKGAIVGHDQRYADFVSGADLVIHDAQYTASEYPSKIGWGHSTGEYAVHICRESAVKAVALTHHDPLRDDLAVDRILADMRRLVSESGSALEVIGAAEGECIELAGSAKTATPTAAAGFLATAVIEPVALDRPVVIWVQDAELRSLLEQAVAEEGMSVEGVTDEPALLRAIRALQPAVAVVQHHPPATDGIAIIQAIRRSEAAGAVQVPVAVVATEEDIAQRGSEIPTDWLVKPFSLSYARAKIRAWALRTASRWIRAKIPPDESRRLGDLRDLAILDTQREARFDRLTRLASATFNVPIALVSLVDRDRQWFKSCFGLEATETSRDMAFCAHVVHQREDLVVADTLMDARFAENPLVTGGPRIRFYAGVPLILSGGSCIGTFCLIDVRPHLLDEAQMTLLHDLRDLACEEIEHGRASVS